NYFRMFEKLSGMTGTAITEAGEFHKIYTLDVVSIPTNLPLVRDDAHDVVYRTEPEKWKAIVDEIERLQEKGQPVLVGTASVETSELVSKKLRAAHIQHEVLNAKNHEREAQIIAMAGEVGAVTVATNMAGRGTDIKLGGNFEYRLGLALEEKELVEGDVEHLAEIDAVREQVRARCKEDERQVLENGGLYVLGTERHEARRIDNQLRGRSGRQGDAGESRFFLSLQDPLMRIFYREWVTNMMEKMGMSEGQEIESGMVSRAIARAQKKVEDRNFEIRKSLLEYDEVMNAQRKEIYRVRQAVLKGSALKEKILIMMSNVVERQSRVYSDDPQGLQEWGLKTFGIELDVAAARQATESEEKDRDTSAVQEAVAARYDVREEELGGELMRRVEQYLMLNALDSKWKDHLHAIDALKAGIGLRGYGQQDPKIAYKKEGTEFFEEKLKPAIEEEVASLILRIQAGAGAGGGDGEGSAGGDPGGPSPLIPRGMGPGGPAQPNAEQLRAMRRQMEVHAVRRAMRQQVPASSAFDVMKKRRAAQGVPSTRGTGTATKEPSLPKPSDEFRGVGRNDACPCGSGKKFKKCHGAG
ncbi:MAG: SEC-C metal-binding domain-containing protein, partial [Planctomycetota bacterium]